MIDKNAFRKELKALLLKYNASISFSVDPTSDTHGLYDEKMKVFVCEPDSFHETDIIVVEGWQITAHDLNS